MSSVLFIDCDRIHDFVFSYNRLRFIRNASALLSEINTDKTIKVAEKNHGEIIYTAGGVSKILFRDQDNGVAEKVAFELEKIYRSFGASITWHIVDCDDTQLNSDKFAKDVIMVGERKIQEKKASRHQAKTSFGWNYLSPCEVSNDPTAEYLLQDGTDILRVSNRAFKTWCKDGKYYGSINKILEGTRRKIQIEGVELRYPRTFSGLLSHSQTEETLSEDQPGQERMLGFLYADANRMGNWLQRFEGNAEVYKQFAQGLEECLVDALVLALYTTFASEIRTYPTEELSGGKKVVTLPFLPILVGGDDVIITMPANRVLQFADRFCQEFQEKTKNNRDVSTPIYADEGISISSGVAISHPNFPIISYLYLSEQLLHNAKKLSQATKDNNEEISTVDFAVVTSPVAEELSPTRQAMRRVYGSEHLHLYGRPYTITGSHPFKLDNLLKAASLLQGKVPRSRIKDISTILAQEPQMARLHLTEAFRRDEDGIRAYRKAIECFGITPGTNPYYLEDNEAWPFLDKPNWADGKYSFLSDIIEIFDIIST